jgi:hypothetical protein
MKFRDFEVFLWDRKVVFDEIVVNESWRRPVGPDRRKELGAEVQNFTGSL